MGFMLAPIQSRVTIPSFVLLLPSGRSSSLPFFIFLTVRSLDVLSVGCSASPLTLSSARPRARRTVTYISRGSFAHHRLAAVLASRESEFLPPCPPFLAFSLPPSLFLPPLLPLPPSPFDLPGFLRRPSYPRYVYVYSRAFRFYSFHRCTRISLCLPSRPPPLPRLLSLVPSRFIRREEHVREVRFPLSVSLSLSSRLPALVLLVLFAPSRFTTGAGRLCPPRTIRPSTSRAYPSCSSRLHRSLSLSVSPFALFTACAAGSFQLGPTSASLSISPAGGAVTGA